MKKPTPRVRGQRARRAVHVARPAAYFAVALAGRFLHSSSVTLLCRLFSRLVLGRRCLVSRILRNRAVDHQLGNVFTPLGIFRRLLPPLIRFARPNEIDIGAEVLAIRTSAVAGTVLEKAKILRSKSAHGANCTHVEIAAVKMDIALHGTSVLLFPVRGPVREVVAPRTAVERRPILAKLEDVPVARVNIELFVKANQTRQEQLAFSERKRMLQFLVNEKCAVISTGDGHSRGRNVTGKIEMDWLPCIVGARDLWPALHCQGHPVADERIAADPKLDIAEVRIPLLELNPAERSHTILDRAPTARRDTCADTDSSAGKQLRISN